MDIISWIKTTLSKYSSNNTHDKNAIYFVKNEDGKTGKIISDEVVYGNGGGANGVVVESSNQPTGGESVWVNPDEDMEEVEVYSRQQTDALINTKQNELTLTVKDNGNIVIANIQGQSKEFMPATPSGDPMHYAYVEAGAKYNDTGADIIRKTPWANIVDDDVDKTVVHKAGYWYLNGLGDITTEQMRTIFIETNNLFEPADKYAGICQLLKSRVNLYRGSSSTHYSRGVTDWNSMLNGSKMEVVYILADELYSPRPNNLGALARGNRVVFIIYCIFNCSNTTNFGGLADNAISLKYMWLKSVKKSVSLNSCSKFANCCILYMIQNEAATSAITITLHADAYARAMANADIVAALEAHPNVSLASA